MQHRQPSLRGYGAGEHGRGPAHVTEVILIGIGERLTAPPLPHHLAYGSRTSAVRLG